MRATGPIANDPTFVNEMNQEVQDIEDGLKEFKYYPVFTLGITFKLGL